MPAAGRSEKSMLRRFSIFVSALLCISFSYVAGHFSGFDGGFTIGTESSTHWVVSGGTAYGNIAHQYFLIFLASLAYLLLQEIPSNRTWPFVAKIMILAAMFIHGADIYKQKIIYINDSEVFSEIMRRSISFDIICACAIVFLLVCEMIRMRSRSSTGFIGSASRKIGYD
jgi:hypothetical protein